MNTKNLTLVFSFLTLFLAFLMASCQQQGLLVQEPSHGQGTLTVMLEAPQAQASSRALTPDPALSAQDIAQNPNNAGDLWAPWWQLVDGRKLYNLTIFLLSGDNVVSYCQLQRPLGASLMSEGMNAEGFISDDTRSARVSFTNLEDGTYTLLGVANYLPVEAEDEQGQMQQYEGNELIMERVDALVSELLSGRQVTTSSQVYQELFSTTITTDESFLCRKVPQALTMQQEVVLSREANVAKATLRRTYARVRMRVTNDSNEVLMIVNIRFSEDFLQREAYLFDHSGMDDEGFDFEKGVPDLYSENAIVGLSEDGSNPFDKINTTIIAGIGGVDMEEMPEWLEEQIHSPENYGVPFDAYVLENGYIKTPSYYVFVSYPQSPVISHSQSLDEWLIGADDFMYMDEEGLFCGIQVEASDLSSADDPFYFLYQDNEDYNALPALYHEKDKGEVVTSSSPTFDQVNELLYDGRRDMFWQILPSQTPDCFVLRNADSGKYLSFSGQEGSALRLTSEPEDLILDYDEDTQFFTFKSASSNLYLASALDDEQKTKDGSSPNMLYAKGAAAPSRLRLYLGMDATVEEEEVKGARIQILEYDEQSMTNKPLLVLHRNDFLHLSFSVVHAHSAKDTFIEVRPWTEVSGDIEFN